jgi:hypothetical protein
VRARASRVRLRAVLVQETATTQTHSRRQAYTGLMESSAAGSDRYRRRQALYRGLCSLSEPGTGRAQAGTTTSFPTALVYR